MPFKKKYFERLFYPEQIAIIGASSKAEKVGFAILKNLLDSGYTGKLFPVNPHAKKILGVKTYLNVNQIKQSVDLAIIAVSAHLVPAILQECHQKHIKTSIVISAGFKETGMASGQVLEEKLIHVIAENELFVIGPNCLGIINTDTKINLNATFARARPRKGNIAFISQSGAIGIHALEFAEKHDIGFSKFITIGNKSVVDENDLIDYLYSDSETSVILLYLESFSDGIRFREVLKRNNLTHRKPVVLLKAGRSESGQKAALSHTGALTGEDGMINYFLEDCGVVRVDTMQQLFSTAMVMANQPVPKGNRLMVLTNAGGLGIMTMDATRNQQLHPVDLAEDERLKLKKGLPQAASTNNPIDILGDAEADRYNFALKFLLKVKVFDVLLIICTPQFMTKRAEILESFKEVIDKARSNNITLAAVFPGVTDETVDGLFDVYDLPNYEFPEQAIEALSYYVKYGEYLKIPESAKDYKAVNRKYQHIKKILDKAKAGNHNYLDEVRSYELLNEYGINIADNHLVINLEEALQYAEKKGYPLVAKIVASGVVHKYDIGGVVVNINDKKQLIEAYKRLSGLVKVQRFKGVLLQTMVSSGVELIMGAKFHQGFGHSIMFGLGGTYVEVMQDVAFAMVPLTEFKAKQMIESIRGVKLLNGFRSQAAINKEALVDMLMKLSHVISDFPEICSLDLNPVFATEKEAIVADARIVL